MDKLDYDEIILRTENFLEKMDILAFVKRFDNYQDDYHNFSFKK